jgi:hypothetical protein
MDRAYLHLASRPIRQLLDESVTGCAMLVRAGTSRFDAVFAQQPDIG